MLPNDDVTKIQYHERIDDGNDDGDVCLCNSKRTQSTVSLE